ncbi:MAG: peptide ABC transporter substrate-binding protein [Planctomycetota bacterium]|nr:peptide ABC transporter substrate-binding protein [Planctomycetota bacterium]
MRRALAILALAVVAACAPPRAELVILNGGDAALLDPQLGSSTAEARIAVALHAGLTRLSADGATPLPDLAESWEHDAVGREWSFLLRAGLRWSDGSALRAADILASWERLIDPATAAPYRNWLANAHFEASADAAGRERIHVRFTEAKPQFAELTALWPLAPVPAAQRALPPGSQADPFVSSGPYRLRFRRVRDRVRVEPNPHYWDAQRLHFGVLDFLAVESPFTALNLFLAGEADYAPQVPRLAAPRLREEHADAFHPTPQFAAIFLRFNLRDAQLRDPDLRLALARAIDRAALAAALGGLREAASGLVPPLLDGWEPRMDPLQYDPAAARGHLAAWRARGGVATPELLVPSSELGRDLAAVLREQWRTTLGLEVRVLGLEGREARAAERAGEYQLSRSSWVGDYLDPETFLAIFRSGDPNNRTGFADAEYDAMLDAAAAAPDSAARFALLARAEERLLSSAAILPLLVDANQELVAPRLTGFVPNPRGYVDWSALGSRP